MGETWKSQVIYKQFRKKIRQVRRQTDDTGRIKEKESRVNS